MSRGLVSEVFSIEQEDTDKREDTNDAPECAEKRNGVQVYVQGYAANKWQQKGDSESQPVAAVVNGDGVEGSHAQQSMSVGPDQLRRWPIVESAGTT